MDVDVTHVEVLAPYRLHLQFDDGTEGDVDIAELVAFDGVFEPLRDPDMFRQVRVEPEYGTIVWPNGADLDPFVLHEWAQGRRVQEVEEGPDPDPEIPPPAMLPSRRPRMDPPPAENPGMHEICRFLGIVVSMPYRDHVPPHFHVQYGERRARFALGPIRLIEGRLSPRTIGLIMEWALMHEDELLEDWDLAQHNRPLNHIQPLE